MRVVYPERIEKKIDEVYSAAAPYMFLNDEKMEWNFVSDTPTDIKKQYELLLKEIRDYEADISA